jgi:putative FmdB family regulatory protein
MAIYDFTCTNCEHTLELTKKISDRDSTELDVCPACLEVGTLKRGLSSPLVGYSTTTPGGYGKIPSGFKDVLNKIHSRAPGSRLDKSSTFL